MKAIELYKEVKDFLESNDDDPDDAYDGKVDLKKVYEDPIDPDGINWQSFVFIEFQGERLAVSCSTVFGIEYSYGFEAIKRVAKRIGVADSMTTTNRIPAGVSREPDAVRV